MTMIAHDLAEMRESLAYWEDRAQRLPLRAIRRRREAREMVVRWRGRVAEAERQVYGRGVLGALLMLISERRMPLATQRAGRQALRRAARVTAVVSLVMVTVVVAGFAALIDAIV
jgi:hypothetical protein